MFTIANVAGKLDLFSVIYFSVPVNTNSHYVERFKNKFRNTNYKYETKMISIFQVLTSLVTMCVVYRNLYFSMNES